MEHMTITLMDANARRLEQGRSKDRTQVRRRMVEAIGEIVRTALDDDQMYVRGPTDWRGQTFLNIATARSDMLEHSNSCQGVGMCRSSV